MTRMALLLVLCAPTLACTTAERVSDPVIPANAARATLTAPSLPAASKPPTTSAIHVDPRIVEACKMPTPHFDFDSAALEPDPSLDILAQCFIAGPMRGRLLRLVGHADPRGEEEYNFLLGQRRAGSVQTYLSQRGVANGSITTTSRGNLDATGTDEAGWAEDRRVEILLGD